MSILKNSQWEKFCLSLISGMAQKDAAIAAGYAKKSSDSKASQLVRQPLIAKRLEELRQETTSKAVMSIQERKERLSVIGRAELVDFIGKDGEPELNSEVKSHGAATEYSVKTTYTKRGDAVVTREIKLRDPVGAIDLLNKMDKLYSDQPTTINNNVIFIIGKGYQVPVLSEGNNAGN